MDTEATPGVKVDFPNPDNLMNFTVNVRPNDGLYKGAEFQFTVDVPNTYPYDPPKVVCNTLVRIRTLPFFLTPLPSYVCSSIR